MIIKNNDPKFYGFETQEFHSAQFEIIADCVLVVKYLRTARCRKHRLEVYFIDDVINIEEVIAWINASFVATN